MTQIDDSAYLKYTGPVKLPTSSNAVTTTKVNHSQFFTYNTTVGGIGNTIFLGNPSAATGWSSLAAEWAEYRVLAFEVEFIPSRKYTANDNRMFVTIVDHADTATTIGSYGSAVDRESAIIHETQQRFKVTAKASGVEEMEWIPTVSPTARFCIKTYMEGSISTGYFQCIVRYLTELRGQQ